MAVFIAAGTDIVGGLSNWSKFPNLSGTVLYICTTVELSVSTIHRAISNFFFQEHLINSSRMLLKQEYHFMAGRNRISMLNSV